MQSPTLTECEVIVGKLSLDFLDNNILGGIDFKSLYHQAISLSYK
jgi:hypothetical protein